MAKFKAMMDMIHLVIPFIERDEKGQLVRDQSIIFNPGIRIGKEKIVPASISVTDPAVLNYMRNYGGNRANGGTSFFEEEEKKTEVKAAVTPKAPAPEPESEPKVEATEYPEVTTVQDASSVLRDLIPDLTTRDSNTKAKVLDLAAKHNISFPNLI